MGVRLEIAFTALKSVGEIRMIAFRNSWGGRLRLVNYPIELFGVCGGESENLYPMTSPLQKF